MNLSGAGLRLSVVVAVALSIALLYHELPDSMFLFQRGAQYLFFLPIVMAGLWFGWRGGVVMAVSCAILLLPKAADQYAEAFDLLLVGSVFGVLADRERRKTQALERASRDLQASYEHLKRAERLSGVGQLAANLAHEIRNPLASIEGAAGLLEHPEALSAGQSAEFAGIIRTESRRLSRLLTEMLDYAKPRRAEFVRIEIAPLLVSVINLVSPTAARGKVQIVSTLGAPAPPPAECDPGQIKQVVLNLLLNAIQAMPGGGLARLECRVHGAQIEIRVSDEGEGVPAGEMEKLFSPFYTTKKDGTGLGLAVAQQIAVRHGGEIAVERNQPRGCVFSFRFPLERKADPA